MKSKITVLIIFSIVIIGSFLISFNINSSPPNLPLAVFSIACTILLASVALPSLLGISQSKIVKGLFFILYTDFIHIFFPIYQVILAVVALITEYSNVGSNTSIFISRLLLVLIILDLFYILLYLRYLINVIGSPKEMLKIFEKRILKKIRKKREKGYEGDIFSEIEMLVKISKDTGMGEEKSAVLKIFEKLLTEVIKFYPRDINIFPTESQYRLWKLLVENVYEVCHNNDNLCSASDLNLSEAIDILNQSWQSIVHWSKTGFDYAVCTRELKKIGNFAITKNYNNSINKLVAVLSKIGEQCISDQSTPRTSPVEIASDMSELGLFTVNVGKDDLTDQFIIHLLNFYETSLEEKYLFYTLRLMSFVWDNNKDALEDLSKKLIGIKEIEFDEAVKYGSICFKRETVRIKRFLDAVDKFNKPGLFALIRKLGKLRKKL